MDHRPSAANHMTHYLNKLDNYVPGNQKIFVADGSAISVAGHGNIKLLLLFPFLISYMSQNR